jgi:hypothetical protein
MTFRFQFLGTAIGLSVVALALVVAYTAVFDPGKKSH